MTLVPGAERGIIPAHGCLLELGEELFVGQVRERS